MKVTFRYERDIVHDQKREYVITRLCQYMAYLIDLPHSVEIEFCKLGKSAYGETVLNPHCKNMIRLNCELLLREILIPLVHELIHLEQIHTGKLSVSRTGQITWEGQMHRAKDLTRMSHRDYTHQPWEQDVAKKQRLLLEKVLDHALEANPKTT